MEVADSSLERDRGWKLRFYARSMIREYWIVNLIDGQMEVYTSPQPQGALPTFAPPAIYRPGDRVPVRLGGLEVAQVAVADVLRT
jgi:Uma2 family endonuclease